MEKEQKPMRAPGILLAVGSVVGILFWLIAVFFALFLGGSAGPDAAQRAVPLHYVAMLCLGLVSAAIGFGAGIKSAARGANIAMDLLLIWCAILSAAGTIPFLLLGLTQVWLIALAFGMLPLASYVVCMQITLRARRG